MLPKVFIATTVALFSAGAFAAPAEEASQAPQIGGHCVPNDKNGNCVVADHGTVKTIPCSPDHKCRGNRHSCNWTGGFASCT